MWWSVARVLAAMALSAAPALAFSDDVLLFGGDGHTEFLGCLNCSKYDAESVHNAFGEYGSRYSATSIFNHYGEYGSPYSDTSACNRYASDPPVIVDREGGFYGRLTLNRFHPQATKNSKLLAWLAAICED